MKMYHHDYFLIWYVYCIGTYLTIGYIACSIYLIQLSCYRRVVYSARKGQWNCWQISREEVYWNMETCCGSVLDINPTTPGASGQTTLFKFPEIEKFYSKTWHYWTCTLLHAYLSHSILLSTPVTQQVNSKTTTWLIQTETLLKHI